MSAYITMIVNNEYWQCKDGDKILYDSRWSFEEFLNGGPIIMTKEQILKDIREVIDYNKTARCSENLSLCKDASRRSNEMLARVIHHIRNTDDYERGANDAWELARKIIGDPIDGGYSLIEMREIFDSIMCSKIIGNHSYQEALTKVKEYEKKKEEEAAKPVLGDVVKPVSIAGGKPYPTGIFLGNNTVETYIMEKNNSTPVRYLGDHFQFIKTGEHIDIQGMLDKIG